MRCGGSGSSGRCCGHFSFGIDYRRARVRLNRGLQSQAHLASRNREHPLHLARSGDLVRIARARFEALAAKGNVSEASKINDRHGYDGDN